jgi:hypothetical protein
MTAPNSMAIPMPTAFYVRWIGSTARLDCRIPRAEGLDALLAKFFSPAPQRSDWVIPCFG